MRISDWSSDVCSSDLLERGRGLGAKLILPADNDAFRDWFAVLVEQSASIRRNLQNLDDVKPLCAVEEDDANEPEHAQDHRGQSTPAIVGGIDAYVGRGHNGDRQYARAGRGEKRRCFWNQPCPALE